MTQLCANFPQLLSCEVLPRCWDPDQRPTLQSSMVIVLGFALKYLRKASTQEGKEEGKLSATTQVGKLSFLSTWTEQEARRVAEESVVILLPYVGSSYGHIRALSQYCFFTIAKQYLPDLVPSSHSIESMKPAMAFSLPQNRGVVTRILLWMMTHPDQIKLREKQHAYFVSFDPAARCTVKGLFTFHAAADFDSVLSDSTTLKEDRKIEQDFDDIQYGVDPAMLLDYCPPPILETLKTAVSEFLTSIRTHYDDDVMNLPEAGDLSARAQPSTFTKATKSAVEIVPEVSEDEKIAQSRANFQKKIDTISFEALLDLAGGAESISTELVTQDADEKEAQHNADVRTRNQMEKNLYSRTRNPIIVISSLIDKAPNLAGVFVCSLSILS